MRFGKADGRLKIAVAQIANLPGDAGTNLAVHLHWIAEARRAGVDLLVFPELSLTGYAAAPDCAALALPSNAAVLTQLAHAADGMAVSVGFIEQGEDGRTYNAQALLRHDRPPAIHRKLNLPGYGKLREDRVYARGDALTLADLDKHWRIATLICADHWNPALPWLAALSGATLMLAPAASARNAVDGFDNPRGWDINLTHTALTYGVPVVFANYGGKSGGEHSNADFWGGSRILNATGHELARADNQATLIIAEVCATDGQAARQRLPTTRDADPVRVQCLLQEYLERDDQALHKAR